MLGFIHTRNRGLDSWKFILEAGIELKGIVLKRLKNVMEEVCMSLCLDVVKLTEEF